MLVRQNYFINVFGSIVNLFMLNNKVVRSPPVSKRTPLSLIQHEKPNFSLKPLKASSS